MILYFYVVCYYVSDLARVYFLEFEWNVFNLYIFEKIYVWFDKKCFRVRLWEIKFFRKVFYEFYVNRLYIFSKIWFYFWGKYFEYGWMN